MRLEPLVQREACRQRELETLYTGQLVGSAGLDCRGLYRDAPSHLREMTAASSSIEQIIEHLE